MSIREFLLHAEIFGGSESVSDQVRFKLSGAVVDLHDIKAHGDRWMPQQAQPCQRSAQDEALLLFGYRFHRCTVLRGASRLYLYKHQHLPFPSYDINLSAAGSAEIPVEHLDFLSSEQSRRGVLPLPAQRMPGIARGDRAVGRESA